MIQNAAVVVWVLLGPFGGWIAAQKYRSPVEGLALGWIFGPLGVIVEALLPTLSPMIEDTPEVKSPPPSVPVERIKEAPPRRRETPPAIDRLTLD
jgi:hypothetical protein